ncbi:MAG: tyrosine-type recombinase/integrase [Anaerolineae bacterium]|nr:tyrosine-type recombinase/integrase [Anaerolineae bacterium]
MANETPISYREIATLVHLWQRAQNEYLHWVETRKGAGVNQRRGNTRKAYATALSQFFNGIKRNLHPLHEHEVLQAGDDISVWPEITPWMVTTDTARRFKVVLSEVGKPVKGTVELASGKRVRSEFDRTGLSETSVNLKLTALKGFFDFVKQFKIPYRPKDHQNLLVARLLHPDETGWKVFLKPADWHNPFEAVELYKVDSTPTYLTVTEIASFFAAINTDNPTGLRDFALYMTLWSTACRIGEIIGMRWGDIQPTSTHYQFSFRGKSGKVEQVEIRREVYQVIIHYLTGVGRLNSMSADSPVFTAVHRDRALRLDSVREAHPDGVPGDAPIGYNTVVKSLKKYAARAGIDPAKAHAYAFRHGRGRQMVASMTKKSGEVDILKINEVLRHSSLNITKYYAELLIDALDELADEAIDVAMSGRRKRSASDADEIARLRARVAELEKKLEEDD